jgi:hypothetical protein
MIVRIMSYKERQLLSVVLQCAADLLLAGANLDLPSGHAQQLGTPPFLAYASRQ